MQVGKDDNGDAFSVLAFTLPRGVSDTLSDRCVTIGRVHDAPHYSARSAPSAFNRHLVVHLVSRGGQVGPAQPRCAPPMAFSAASKSTAGLSLV